MSEYTEQAEQFLKSHNLEFRAVLIGSDCPLHCADAEKGIDLDKVDSYPRKTHIHGKHYRCTVSGKDRGHVSFDFWNSYRDEYMLWCASVKSWECLNLQVSKDRQKAIQEKRDGLLRVSAYDLLACIQKSDVGTFEDFCSEFGYDSDSRKAESTYNAVVKEWHKVSRFFTPEELEQLQDIS